MIRKRRIVAVAAAALLAAGPASGEARAQETSEDSTLMREVFDYPSADRRDPFEPLSTEQELGPRFEDLRLAGVIYSPDRGSVAVLVDEATERRYRVWEGDVIGGARLISVGQDHAQFLVTVFGVSRRDTLRLNPQDKEQDS
ncbi:MAG: hypothetical protein ACODAA_01920 [Gemmatimonadota bacterium]